MGFTEQLARVGEIRHAETPGTYIKQRVAEHAAQLSNGARIQGSIECANEALCKLAVVLYETIDRQPVNVDSKTYRLLIPVPWGDSGYRQWGVRSTEARILRAVLMARATSDKAALFDYGDRQWFLNAATYVNSKAALEYLHSKPVTAREWMKFSNAWRTQERQRINARVTHRDRVSHK